MSKAVFYGPNIAVEGFPFQGGSKLTLHRNHFACNVLCRFHNNSLSSVDQSGAAGFDAFRNALGLNPRLGNKVEGFRFERWLLKTFINLELLADFDRSIPVELVEIAFGRRPFRPGSGLFMMQPREVHSAENDRLTCVRLHLPAKGNSVPAAQFVICGIHFLLALGPFPSNTPIEFENTDGTVETQRLLHHPKLIEFDDGHAIVIDWTRGQRRGSSS